MAATQIDTLSALNIGGTSFNIGEFYLFTATLFIGLLASIIPAIQAARTNISQALSE